MDISKLIKNSLIVALFFTVLGATALRSGCRLLYYGNNFLCVFEILFLVVGSIAWAAFSYGIFMFGFQQTDQRRQLSELRERKDRQLRELKEQKDRQLQQQKNRITELEAELSMEREEIKKFQDKSVEYQKQRENKIKELEAELSMEREEVKKFQDKSVEYQKQRENKIKELEAKIAQLTKSGEEQSEQVIISLENVNNINIDDREEGTSQNPC